MTTPNRTIRKFHPGTFQTDKEMIDQFVVREDELNTILEILRKNIASSCHQHALVVAKRGQGKTMLLARVMAELRTNNDFSNDLLPVRFMEESYNMDNMTDFWIETLFYLANELTTQDSKLTQELEAIHNDLTSRRYERTTEANARAAVLNAANRLGKKFVLMVENLQSIYKHADDGFDLELRDALQAAPQIVLLATATSCFETSDDEEQPFSGLFHQTLVLESLNPNECERLWKKISGDTPTNRKIEALRILTGGNPRLLVILSAFDAQHRSLSQLMQELVSLVDEHTEYFRSGLEVLCKTERRVYVAILDLWWPSSASEIAAHACMDIRVVSTMLKRLVGRGGVVAEGSGRKHRYAAAERLSSIYYKLRRERSQAAVVRIILRAMEVFYGPGLKELGQEGHDQAHQRNKNEMARS